ncbi:hypothetical protein [Simplicispira psychrophila]|uniref:baeRF3 domain-containing protein n=1 Tax=Simplicispira psychrophila TaxID=80882 RepID=UPI000484F405|nr:hypothetical protein [Simplicispira psychrophila]
MNSLALDYPSVLLRNEEAPCLSLYQPTHRQHPDNVQDPIRFRNLMKEMEASLRQQYPQREVGPLLAPFEALANDDAFWNHTSEGLAVLSAPGVFRVYQLPRPVTELVVVADSFHTKPLLRITQSADHYQVLGLSRNSFKLFEGNRDSLRQVQLPADTAQTAEAMLGNDTARHGTDVQQAASAHATKQFFRAVDQAVMQHYGPSGGMGLILAALPEHHHLFRSISKNPQLRKEALDVHPDAMPLEALRECAWQLVQADYLERLAGLITAYGAAAAKAQGSDALGDIAKAAVAGRVATLLIEADRLIPGHLQTTTGKVTARRLDDPQVDDLLDDLGELVLKAGGDVVVVPVQRMPTSTGAAAIYRF